MSLEAYSEVNRKILEKCKQISEEGNRTRVAILAKELDELFAERDRFTPSHENPSAGRLERRGRLL
jgi:hypothetical protein